MILLRILPLFIIFSICESSWIVLWGQPYQWSCCYQTEASNWTDCLDQCMDDGGCMLTYLNSSTCYLCEVGQVSSIQQESSASSQIVAFKATVDSCAVSPLTEYTTTDYTVTLSDGYWSFSYIATTEDDSDETTTSLTTTTPLASSTPKPLFTTTIIGFACPSGWRYYSRPMGVFGIQGVCLKVFSGTVTQTTAAANCATYGAVLSGIENAEEKTWVIDQGIAIIRSLAGNYYQGALWVGAERVDGCRGLGKCVRNCTPWANNAYQWTDESTTLKTMMTWAPTQPDYIERSENCVQMAIVNRTDGTDGAVSGQLYDISCSSSTATKTINYIRGYVCRLIAANIYSSI